jgi:hypothetical protein
MVKAASLTSLVDPFRTSLTRTRACEVCVPGNVQPKLAADAGVEATRVDQLLPLSIEHSIFTFETAVELQLIVVLAPAAKVSPPLGERTVTVGTTGVRVVKLLEPEKALVPPAFFALTLQ